MAVFQAAADESDGPTQRGPFLYGGFVAPVRDWIDWFTPAWDERVLNASPPIPHLHMADIRSGTWRAKYGLTMQDAERRVDEAVRVIVSMGSLYLALSGMDGGLFRDKFKAIKLPRRGPQPGSFVFEPDYVGFVGFAYSVLDYVAKNYSEAEKVDFVVEKKQRIAQNLTYFYDDLAAALRNDGRPDLVPLIGALIPGGKDLAPLQAADVAMWHLRRHAVIECDPTDTGRVRRMFDGKHFNVSGLTRQQISNLEMRSAVKSTADQFPAESQTRRRRRLGRAP